MYCMFIFILQIEPWWPRGYGDAKLYELNVYFRLESGLIISKQIKTGFRTVELVQEEIDTGIIILFII